MHGVRPKAEENACVRDRVELVHGRPRERAGGRRRRGIHRVGEATAESDFGGPGGPFNGFLSQLGVVLLGFAVKEAYKLYMDFFHDD